MPQRPDTAPGVRASARGSAFGRRTRPRAAGEPPGGVATPQGAEDRRTRHASIRRNTPRVLHRSAGTRRVAALARWVLGRRPGVLQERGCGHENCTWEEEAVNRTIETAPARQSLVVDASPPQAFAVFTSGVDRWWPKSHGIGHL